MALEDNLCTLVPYFTVQSGKLDEFKSLGDQMVERTRTEKDCIFYGFSFNGDKAHCREGYQSAEGILAHLGNVDALLKQALEIASLDSLEVHAPAAEIEKLKQPLAALNPTYYVVESGFRNT